MKKHMILKEMPEDDRPREKLRHYGPSKLSNAELLALIIRTGYHKMTAVNLSRNILYHYEDDLSKLMGITVDELMGNPELKGIGLAKACQIVASIELGRRVRRTAIADIKFTSPEEVAFYFMEEMASLKEEHFRVILLDTKKKLIKIEEVSIGTVNASLVHPREVFVKAIRQHASTLILLHNHPSGDPQASAEDIKITNRLIEGGDLLGISIIDHIIIGEGCYLSFREQGLL